ncbi:hypothetical protein LINGRAHAP2_LOCUS20755, partial [Linum grandiflorum]
PKIWVSEGSKSLNPVNLPKLNVDRRDILLDRLRDRLLQFSRTQRRLNITTISDGDPQLGFFSSSIEHVFVVRSMEPAGDASCCQEAADSLQVLGTSHLCSRSSFKLSLRRSPVLRDRLFTAVLAGAFIHGGYLVTDLYDAESK